MEHKSPGTLFLLIVFSALSAVFFISSIPELCAIACLMSLFLVFSWAKFLDVTICPKERPYKASNGFIVMSTSQASAEAYAKHLEHEYHEWFDNLEKRV